MKIVRLHPNSPEGWALWPVLEQRMQTFGETLAQERQRPEMFRWLRDRFVNAPDLLGAWLGLDDASSEVLGHLVAWVDTFFGEPFIFVEQVWVDPGQVAPIKDRMVEELRHWVDELNWAYERSGVTTRIERLRFSTRRDEAAWGRYLRNLGTVEKERTVITVRVPVTPPQREVETLVLPPWVERSGQLPVNGSSSATVGEVA